MNAINHFCHTYRNFLTVTCVGLIFFCFNNNALAAKCEYLVSNQWNSGFTALIRITNNSSANINGWSISWQYNKDRLVDGWNTNLIGNNPYSASNLDWNKTIAAGQFIEFGVKGTKDGATPETPSFSGALCTGASQPAASVTASSKPAASTPASSKPASSSPAQITWKHCADEKETCSFKGQTTVRYGAINAWATKTITASTACTNAVFGDPIPGTRKSCQVPANVTLSDPEPKALTPLATAEVLSASKLVDKAHVSDGTDRMLNGVRRFQDELGANAITYTGYQYVIYYTGKDRSKGDAATSKVMVARRKLGGNWEHAEVKGYTLTSEDAHNRNEIGISTGDGVIHITFDHHNSKTFNYAATKVGVANYPDTTAWDDSVFTYNANAGLPASTFSDNLTSVTYPAFYATTRGNLVLYYRGGGANNGAMIIGKYDADSHKWLFTRKFSSPTGTYNGSYGTRGPYAAAGSIIAPNGDLKITWIWREETARCLNQSTDHRKCGHGIYFARSPDEGVAWYNQAGDLVTDLNSNKLLSVDNIGRPVVDVPQNVGPSNTSNNSAIDPKTGNVHVMMRHLNAPNGQEVMNHYLGTPNGSWSRLSASNASTGGNISFVGDIAYSLGGSTISYATRATNFTDWKQITLPQVQGPKGTQALNDGGTANWDLGRLEEGIASLVWQFKTTDVLNGAPSPIWVYELRLAE